MRARHVAFGYAAAVAGVLALGAWLFWPVLHFGLFSDDYAAEAMLGGRYGAPRGPFDLFNFVDGSAEDVHALQRYGTIPWWASPDLRISFLRPLSSALVQIDHALFGSAVWAYHLHSLLAWAGLVIAVAALYRRLIPALPAAFATAVFALDQSQHFPVSWLCNRGGLYAVLFAVIGLHQYLRARWDRAPYAALLAAACFSVALAFGEWALPMLGYVLAFELCCGRDRLVARALALWPAVAPTLVFLGARAWLGYGARGSEVYVDPAADPAAFGLLLLHRVPVLIADMLFNVPASWWNHGSPWRQTILEAELIPPRLWLQLPDFRAFHVLIGAFAVMALLLLVRFSVRDMSRDERGRVRFLLLGALLALLPVVGSFPSTRLTLSAMFGMAPVFALGLRSVGRRLIATPSPRLPRFLATYALGALLIEFQLIDSLRADVQPMLDDFSTSTEWVLSAEIDPASVAQQRVLVLSALEFSTTFFFVHAWSYHGHPLPKAFYPISMAPYPHDLERVDERTLRMRTLGGSFLGGPAEVHFRPGKRWIREGDVVRLDGLSVTAERVVDGRPQSLRLTFDRPLEDPGYLFLASTPEGLVRIAPPVVGAIRRLPRASGPNWATLARARYERRIGPLPESFRYTPVPSFVAYRP